MTKSRQMRWWRWVAVVSGSTLILEGCNPTLQSTVEDGIITLSTSLFGSFLRALTELASEETTETTAQVLTELVQRFVA